MHAARIKKSGGRKIYWLSPGWLENWKQIFKEWDAAKSNETFPQNDKAVLLDVVQELILCLLQKLLEKRDKFLLWIKTRASLGLESQN